jgi:hypothetical protein
LCAAVILGDTALAVKHKKAMIAKGAWACRQGRGLAKVERYVASDMFNLWRIARDGPACYFTYCLFYAYDTCVLPIAYYLLPITCYMILTRARHPRPAPSPEAFNGDGKVRQERHEKSGAER